MANNQNILFEEKTLEDLYTFLNSVGLKDIEKLENKLLVEFQNDRWSVGMALDKLNELSNRQLSRINSTFDLKQSIIGLILTSPSTTTGLSTILCIPKTPD